MMSLATLPALDVVLGGELSEALLASLAAVRVDEMLGRPAQCELSFIDPPDEALDQALVGSDMSVEYSETGDEVFAGHVTALEVIHDGAGVTTAKVRGYSALNDAGNSQAVRTFEDMNVGEIVREVLADAGLSVEVDCETSTRLHVTQYNESDLQFVDRLLGEEGVWLTTRAAAVTVFAPDSGIREMEFLELGLNLLEVAIEVNQHRATAAVTAQSWSPATGEAADPEATVGRTTHALSGDGSERTVSGVLSSDGRAAAIAQSSLDHRSASDATVRGTAEGSATLRPGVVVALEGVAAPFDDSYLVATVTHTFDGRGYLSEFTTDLPERSHKSAEPFATIGVVLDVADPEEIGRVRVTYSSFGDIESPWLLVALPGGSQTAGLVCLPSVGDTVLVVLADGSPSHGVVVGGLAAAPGIEDAGVDDGATMRYLLVTPGGHRVSLDDSSKTVRIEDITGSFLQMAPDGVTMHGAVDITIEAPGRAIAIAGNTIDFRRS